MQTKKPNLSDGYEDWDRVKVVLTKYSVPHVTAEKRSAHRFDPLGRALVNGKSPGKDG